MALKRKTIVELKGTFQLQDLLDAFQEFDNTAIVKVSLEDMDDVAYLSITDEEE